jgi:hypothetical protein
MGERFEIGIIKRIFKRYSWKYLINCTSGGKDAIAYEYILSIEFP